ncbi:Hsp20/alpha crystallin family protein [Sphingopyxis sp. Q841]
MRAANPKPCFRRVFMNEMSPAPAEKSTAPTPVPAEFGALDWFRAEVDRFIDEMGKPGRSLLSFVPRFVIPKPAIELTDAGDIYRLSAELPGLTEKDVKIEIADGILTISAEKRESTKRQEEGCLINERRHGHFERQISLPVDVDEAKVKARFKHGLLTLEIGKDAGARKPVRKIKIEN